MSQDPADITCFIERGRENLTSAAIYSQTSPILLYIRGAGDIPVTPQCNRIMGLPSHWRTQRMHTVLLQICPKIRSLRRRLSLCCLVNGTDFSAEHKSCLLRQPPSRTRHMQHVTQPHSIPFHAQAPASHTLILLIKFFRPLVHNWSINLIEICWNHKRTLVHFI